MDANCFPKLPSNTSGFMNMRMSLNSSSTISPYMMRREGLLHTGLEFLKKVLSKWSDIVEELTHNLSSNTFVTTLRECGMFINCTFGG